MYSCQGHTVFDDCLVMGPSQIYKATGEEVLTFIGFMGFANFPRLERNRLPALPFAGIPFCLWVVLGLFGGFNDRSACLDNFVAGLKKNRYWQGMNWVTWTGY